MVIAGLLACALTLGVEQRSAKAAEADDPWPGLVRDVFNGREIADGAGLLVLDTPYRAEDAALVPLTVRTTLPAGDARYVKNLTVVIDKNPAPVAATFQIGASSGISSISTRVRVDMYTDVHAVAELSDGKLYAVKTFVKASGGCSAPAAKTADEAKSSIGQMRFRQFAKTDAPVSRAREAQIMVRHPNNSGLQMDQITRHYVPIFFVRDLKVWQGDTLVFAMEGGISISEDPNIRFNYMPNGAKTFRVEATDTNDTVYRGEWPADTSEM